MKLNQKQELVVNTLDKNIFLIASAGTGKTAVLSERVYNIIKQKVAKEEEILCITFTNKAAKEMKERIESRLGGSVKCTIKTFHSFCLEVMRSNVKDKTDIPTDFNVVDEEDAREAVKKISMIQARGYEKSFINIGMIHKFIDVIKSYRLKWDFFSDDDAIDYRKCIKNLSDAANKEILIGCFKEKGFINKKLMEYMVAYGPHYISFYNKQLRSDKAVDFNDLITYTKLLFNDHNITDYYKAKYKFINIDEVQDSATCC